MTHTPTRQTASQRACGAPGRAGGFPGYLGSDWAQLTPQVPSADIRRGRPWRLAGGFVIGAGIFLPLLPLGSVLVMPVIGLGCALVLWGLRRRS